MDKAFPTWFWYLHEDGAKNSRDQGTTHWIIRSKNGQLTPASFQWGFKKEKTRSGLSPKCVKVESASRYPFGESWKCQRCLVPIDGWYESKEKNREKHLYYVASKNGQPIFLAGIWSGATYAILTSNTDSGIEGRDIRNPIALEPENGWKWMNEGFLTAGHLLEASVSASKLQWLQVDEVMSRHCYERTPFKFFN